MAETYNVYLDESCHLEHDQSQIMVLGTLYCLADKTQEIADRIRDIRESHGLSPNFEIKWTKVSSSKVAFYRSLVDYFLDDDDLQFRAMVITDKSALKEYDPEHDNCYYSVCYSLLDSIIDPEQRYCIYLDMKDTRSEQKRLHLESILRDKTRDGNGRVIRRVQQIRSHESVLMQLADLLIGIVSYANRNLSGNEGKMALIERVRERTQLSLTRSTWLRARKFSLVRWPTRDS